MKLLKTFTHNRESGFTMIEIMVVLAIFGALMITGLFFDFSFFRTSSINYEGKLLAGIIQRARSQAMANIDQTKHGVCVTGSNYVIFEGSSCTGGDNFPKAAAVTVTWPAGVTAVVFNQLEGSLCTTACGVTAPMTITLTDQVKTLNITINNEGRIDF